MPFTNVSDTVRSTVFAASLTALSRYTIVVEKSRGDERANAAVRRIGVVRDRNDILMVRRCLFTLMISYFELVEMDGGFVLVLLDEL